MSRGDQMRSVDDCCAVRVLVTLIDTWPRVHHRRAGSRARPMRGLARAKESWRDPCARATWSISNRRDRVSQRFQIGACVCGDEFDRAWSCRLVMVRDRRRATGPIRFSVDGEAGVDAMAVFGRSRLDQQCISGGGDFGFPQTSIPTMIDERDTGLPRR